MVSWKAISKKVVATTILAGGLLVAHQFVAEAAPGIIEFDIHPGASLGSVDVVVDLRMVLAETYPTFTGPWTIALNEAQYLSDTTTYQGYFTNTFSQINGPANPPGGTPTFGAVDVPVTLGLGCVSSCAQGGNTQAEPFLLQVSYDPNGNKGYYMSNAAFGFTIAGASYWVEGDASTSGIAGIDVHQAFLEANGTYSSPTAGTGTTVVGNPNVECMSVTPTELKYCPTAQPLPEIDGSSLPKAGLLLGSLYLLARRRLKIAA